MSFWKRNSLPKFLHSKSRTIFYSKQRFSLKWTEFRSCTNVKQPFLEIIRMKIIKKSFFPVEILSCLNKPLTNAFQTTIFTSLSVYVFTTNFLFVWLKFLIFINIWFDWTCPKSYSNHFHFESYSFKFSAPLSFFERNFEHRNRSK